MENMEKATNVNKENWITLSKTGTTLFVLSELVSGKIFSKFKNEGLFFFGILFYDWKQYFTVQAKDI